MTPATIPPPLAPSPVVADLGAAPPTIASLAMGVRPIKYSEIRDKLRTGDIITFEGHSPLDWLIQLESHSPYNHVGMVIRRKDGLFFWDAPGGGPQFPDPYMNGQKHFGCRVAPLDDLLAVYMKKETAMYLRQIQPALTDRQVAALELFISVADGLPFPGSHTQLAAGQAGIGVGCATSYEMGKRLGLTHVGHFFCAQLTADSYMHMGLLPIAQHPANAYRPADFDAPSFSLPDPYTLTPVVQVIWDRKRSATH